MNKNVTAYMIGLLVVIMFFLGFIAGKSTYENRKPNIIQYCDETQHKMILNIGIAIGYLSSKQGIDEKVLYSEGMKLYNIIAKPVDTDTKK